MSQKPNKNGAQTSKTTPAGGGARLLPEESQQVHKLIEGRHSKAALQLAKDLFKRCDSPEAEALLVKAYKARIDDLLKLGLSVEAKALLGIVRDRFPAAAARLEEQDREISAIEGRLDGVVGPLGDPNLPAADRDRIEAFVRQKVYDLPALASVSSLPPEHPLRKAASALAGAFQAVTQGPVDDALLELPDVSRRSPLAPWKALVRAIASYYRRDDEECRKWLQAIAADSLPARLIPSLNAMTGTMIGTKTRAKFGPAEQKLIAAAGDQGAALCSALADLEEAFKFRKQGRILDATRNAVATMNHMDGEARQRLRHHIAVRAPTQDLDPEAFLAALGGSLRRDAYYLRLSARSLEERRIVECTAEAVLVWESFRREAIKEKWFSAGGLEDGVLSLHLAQLREKIPPEIVAEMLQEQAFYGKPGEAGKEGVLPSPGLLYERACKADPSAEAFQMWLTWAKKAGSWQVADNVAEAWRTSRPKDIQPLLYLMESAEERSAYKKSLKYLEEAEELDRLNPEVRRAKLRLLLAAAIRHLRQGKTHLAKPGIEQLESVPEVRPGEVAALAAALRWYCAALDSDPADRLRQEANLKHALGEVAAFLLLSAIAKAGELGPKATSSLPQVAPPPAAELLIGAAKACVLGQWAGLPIPLPLGWCAPLIAAQKLPQSPLDAAQMLALGEAALASGSADLAYAVSVAGLAGGRANARFLFLRARSVPRWAALRQDGCSLAALELARRDRDTDLAGKILDWQHADLRGRSVTPELLRQILEEEQELKQIPVQSDREPKYAAAVELWDEDEDDFDEDDDDFDEPVPPFFAEWMNRLGGILGQLPPELTQQLKRAVAAGEDPVTAMNGAIDKMFPGSLSGPAAKKAKPAKAPLPGQGSLF